jgi:putative ABC transport system permease protein
MRHDLYLAWRYLRYHKARSLILIGCLSLIAILPLALHQLLDEGKRQMTARAEATPLLIGAKGSAVDLTLSTLYFSEATPKPITVAEVERVAATTWAEPLPIYARFRVQGHALIGVTLDYFDFRHLAADRGQMLTVLGDCVLGADAAAELGLEPGDTLLTTPENLFDLAGIYPLKLHVAGVLSKARTPDDQAVFIDLQTAWVIEGLGHGHAEQGRPAARAVLGFGRSEQDLSADAKLVTYTEITPENLDSFHFHGDPAQYPITGLIAVPHDRRSGTLLRGRYLADDDALQIVQPELITRGLLQTIFRVGALFDAILMLVGSATLLALALVFALSLRLRQREIQTIFLLGCSRLTVARLVAAEIALITLASAVLCLILLQPIKHYAGDMVRLFVIP